MWGPPVWSGFRFAPVTSSLFAYHSYHSELLDLCSPHCPITHDLWSRNWHEECTLWGGCWPPPALRKCNRCGHRCCCPREGCVEDISEFIRKEEPILLEWPRLVLWVRKLVTQRAARRHIDTGHDKWMPNTPSWCSLTPATIEHDLSPVLQSCVRILVGFFVKPEPLAHRPWCDDTVLPCLGDGFDGEPVHVSQHLRDCGFAVAMQFTFVEAIFDECCVNPLSQARALRDSFWHSRPRRQHLSLWRIPQGCSEMAPPGSSTISQSRPANQLGPHTNYYDCFTHISILCVTLW